MNVHGPRNVDFNRRKVAHVLEILSGVDTQYSPGWICYRLCLATQDLETYALDPKEIRLGKSRPHNNFAVSSIISSTLKVQLQFCVCCDNMVGTKI